MVFSITQPSLCRMEEKAWLHTAMLLSPLFKLKQISAVDMSFLYKLYGPDFSCLLFVEAFLGWRGMWMLVWALGSS